MQTVGIDQLVGRHLGQYQLEQLLGRGELSTVYIAQRAGQEQQAMVILFNPPKGVSAQELQQFSLRFAQEGAALVKLKHPHILPTHEFGELAGHPYLVTTLVKGVSLNQLRQQQGRFTAQQTLDLLKQMATALDYAHSSGIVHGALSISNILISQDSGVQIINFGLRTVLEANRRIQKGETVDAQSDIFALGSILYELLSGTAPFEGTNLSKSALKSSRQPIPSIHARYPDVPEALDLVISKVLGQDASKGYPCAGDIVVAFEHALSGQAQGTGSAQGKISTNAANALQSLGDSQVTLPPSVNWFEEASMFPDQSGGREEWEQGSSVGRVPSVSSSMPAAASETFTGIRAVGGGESTPAGSTVKARRGAETLKLWSVTEVGPETQRPVAGTFSGSSTRPGSFAPHAQRPVQYNRRKVVALIATGTVATTAFALGGVNLLHHMQQSPAQVANGSTKMNNAIAAANTTANAQATKTSQITPTPTQAQPTPTQAQPTPTQAQPTPQPTSPPPPAHTGTVIGYTNQGTNSAKSFTNPADGQDTLLIHLPSGSFVAAETACTHQGVTVKYNANTQTLDCPAHGASFDATNGFSYISGSFSRQLSSLTAVTVRVNNDGTVTTG